MDLLVDAAVLTANSVVHDWLTLYFVTVDEDLIALAPLQKPRVHAVLQIFLLMLVGYGIFWCRFGGVLSHYFPKTHIGTLVIYIQYMIWTICPHIIKIT